MVIGAIVNALSFYAKKKQNAFLGNGGERNITFSS